MSRLKGLYTQACPVLFGSGAVAQVGEKVKELGINKVMVVTDAGIIKVGHDKKVIASLDAAGVPWVLFDRSGPDAPDYIVQEAVSIFEEEGCDGLIGIGGGSSLDTAKGIAVAGANNGMTVKEFLAAKLKEYPSLKLIMIPTTSGTGSESTRVAVITNTETHFKGGVRVTATYAIIDPELTLGTPQSITANCGLDAAAHAVEALTSKSYNPHADILALDAIKRIFKWLPVACDEPMNLEAREQLALASNFAGIAFADAHVHLGHVMAHGMGARYHMPHGYACAITTPVVIERSAPVVPEIIESIADAIGLELKEGEDLGKQVADAFRCLMKRVGIPTLAESGYTIEQIDDLYDYVMSDGLRNFACFTLNDEVIHEALKDCYRLYT